MPRAKIPIDDASDGFVPASNPRASATRRSSSATPKRQRPQHQAVTPTYPQHSSGDVAPKRKAPTALLSSTDGVSAPKPARGRPGPKVSHQSTSSRVSTARSPDTPSRTPSKPSHPPRPAPSPGPGPELIAADIPSAHPSLQPDDLEELEAEIPAAQVQSDVQPIAEPDTNDSVCFSCLSDSGTLLLCDWCSRVYHLHCINPPIEPKSVPASDSFCCPSCHLATSPRVPYAGFTSFTDVVDAVRGARRVLVFVASSVSAAAGMPDLVAFAEAIKSSTSADVELAAGGKASTEDVAKAATKAVYGATLAAAGQATPGNKGQGGNPYIDPAALVSLRDFLATYKGHGADIFGAVSGFIGPASPRSGAPRPTSLASYWQQHFLPRAVFTPTYAHGFFSALSRLSQRYMQRLYLEGLEGPWPPALSTDATAATGVGPPSKMVVNCCGAFHVSESTLGGGGSRPLPAAAARQARGPARKASSKAKAEMSDHGAEESDSDLEVSCVIIPSRPVATRKTSDDDIKPQARKSGSFMDAHGGLTVAFDPIALGIPTAAGPAAASSGGKAAAKTKPAAKTEPDRASHRNRSSNTVEMSKCHVGDDSIEQAIEAAFAGDHTLPDLVLVVGAPSTGPMRALPQRVTRSAVIIAIGPDAVTLPGNAPPLLPPALRVPFVTAMRSISEQAAAAAAAAAAVTAAATPARNDTAPTPKGKAARLATTATIDISSDDESAEASSHPRSRSSTGRGRGRGRSRGRGGAAGASGRVLSDSSPAPSADASSAPTLMSRIAKELPPKPAVRLPAAAVAALSGPKERHPRVAALVSAGHALADGSASEQSGSTSAPKNDVFRGSGGFDAQVIGDVHVVLRRLASELGLDESAQAAQRAGCCQAWAGASDDAKKAVLERSRRHTQQYDNKQAPWAPIPELVAGPTPFPVLIPAESELHNKPSVYYDYSFHQVAKNISRK